MRCPYPYNTNSQKQKKDIYRLKKLYYTKENS